MAFHVRGWAEDVMCSLIGDWAIVSCVQAKWKDLYVVAVGFLVATGGVGFRCFGGLHRMTLWRGQ